MARIRSIKPEFWTDGVMVELSIPARLLFVGMWNFTLCDHGHLPDDPKRLKLQVYPADDIDVSELVDELVKHGRVVRGVTDAGKGYLHIPRFPDHQKLDKRWSPRCFVCAGESPAEPPKTSTKLPEPQPNSPKLPETQPFSPQDRTGQDSNKEPPVVPLDETAAEPKTKTRGRKRPAKPLPEDWAPNDDHLALARERGVDPAAELANFRDHAAANDRRQVDWDASFRTWLRRAKPTRPRPLAAARPRPTPRPAPDGPFQFRPPRPGEENRLR